MSCHWDDISLDNRRTIISLLPAETWLSLLLVSKSWNELVYQAVDVSKTFIQQKIIDSAAERGDARVIQQLLQNPFCRPQDQDSSALRMALQKDHTDVAILLIEDGRCNLDFRQGWMLQQAIHNGNVRIVRDIVKRSDPSVDDNRALQVASQLGHFEIVDILLQDGRVDPSSNNSRAVCLAAHGGHSGILTLLFADQRVDPAANNNEALRHACGMGRPECVEILLKQENVIPDRDCADLASSKGHTAILNMIMTHTPGVIGQQCLSIAISGDYVDIIKMLMDSGIRPNHDDLALAASRLNTEAVRLLLPQVKEPQPAFLQAVARGCTDIMKLFLDAGIDPSHDNNRALFLATRNSEKFKETFRLLTSSPKFNASREVLNGLAKMAKEPCRTILEDVLKRDQLPSQAT